MPRYFFHVYNGDDIPDLEGVELPGPEEARNTAVTACGEALKDLDGEFWQFREWRMLVQDWQGRVICELKFHGKR